MLKNIRWLDYNKRENLKMVESSTDFLFSEDLESILSLIEPSVSSEMQTEKT